MAHRYVVTHFGGSLFAEMDVTDASGDVMAQGRKQVYVRRKRSAA